MGLTMTMIGVQLPPLVGQGLLILHLERPDLRPRRRGAGLSRLVAYWQHANVSYDKADNRRSDRLERLLRCSSPPAETCHSKSTVVLTCSMRGQI